ncbi:MAG TPA: hypothetical protein VF761_16830 [Gemmatimonadaceae bacterium]
MKPLHITKIDHEHRADPRIRGMCIGCEWRGPWRRSAAKVDEDRKRHHDEITAAT